MKTIMTFFVAVLTALSINAQSISVSIDSTSLINISDPQSETRVYFNFNSSVDAFLRINYGVNVNDTNTISYGVLAGSDTMSILLSGMLPGTTYQCKVVFFYPVYSESQLVIFTTASCSLNATISSTIINSCSELLTASPSGSIYSFAWTRNNILITGASNATITASNDGSYKVIVSSNICSGTSPAVVVDVNEIPITISNDQTICSGESVTLSSSGGSSYAWSNGANGSSISVSPSVTTTYTVTVTDGGCSRTASVLVTVNSLPEVSITCDRLVACENGNENFVFITTPSNCVLSGSSSLNGNILSPQNLTVGQHIITATFTDGNGCSNSDNITIEVQEELVITGTTSIGSNFRVDGVFTSPIEIVINGTVYNTNTQNSNTALFYNIPEMELGELIIIQYEGGDGCFYYTVYSSVFTTEDKDNIKFFPNPFSDILNVNLPEGNYEVFFKDVLGRNVLELSAKGNFQIQKNNLVKGLYFLQIVEEGKLLISEKIEIQD